MDYILVIRFCTSYSSVTVLRKFQCGPVNSPISQVRGTSHSPSQPSGRGLSRPTPPCGAAPWSAGGWQVLPQRVFVIRRQ